MPFDSGGTFNGLPPPTFPAVSGQRIRADYFNANLNDIFAGLTIAKGAVVGNIISVFAYMTAAQIADVKAGTLLYDHATAFDSALATGLPVYVPSGPGWVYNISHRINVPSNSTIWGNLPKLRLASSVGDNVFSFVNNATNIVIDGIELDGNDAGNPAGCLGISCSPTGGGATYISIRNCHIHDCSGDGIRFFGTTVKYINCYGNTLENNGTAGLTSDDTIEFFTWHGNIARFNGTHGIGLIGIGLDGVISSNTSSDNGQAVPSADNFTGYNAGCKRLTVIGNISRGGLNNGIHFGGDFITYQGNVATGATQYGIVHQSSGVTPATSNGLSMVGNTASGNLGVAGIFVGYCNSGTISGNSSNSNTSHGFYTDTCANLSVTGNTFRSNSGSGMRFPTAATNFTISGNVCANNGADALRYDAMSTSSVTGNVFRSNTGAGINSSGTDLMNIFSSNVIRDNVAGAITGTYDVGTAFSTNIQDTTLALASAATLTLPVFTDLVKLTGTTTVTAINLFRVGRFVTLYIINGLTITEGGILRMQGNFAGTAGSSITFFCDGANVIEQSRMVN